MELLNNMILNEAVRKRVTESKGLQEQLEQLFSVANSYVAEGIKTYTAGGTILGKKPVPFNCHLIKIKALLGMVCILDDLPELFLKLLKAVKLSSITSTLIAVKDNDFLEEMKTRIGYIGEALLFMDPSLGEDRGESIGVEALSKILTSKEMMRAFCRATSE